jgi:hypothetical protein
LRKCWRILALKKTKSSNLIAILKFRLYVNKNVHKNVVIST